MSVPKGRDSFLQTSICQPQHSLPPPPSSAPPHLSLSPRTLPPDSANSAILCAEAPPKPPFCSERGSSQWEREPARPTCRRSSTPKDHLLGGRHARSTVQTHTHEQGRTFETPADEKGLYASWTSSRVSSKPLKYSRNASKLTY